ncbi:hypothetical protein [Terracoccus luteus]|uniref:DUF732 domain-containing protein n=1 Tax=Terracoccus luteus TaxID=53356 RepID=A0A839Q791_9MICO|nr:hypothetical protein [Terracoccus luteus]MBB2988511.1 hypothetical protein [Terracoccus luteus]MCP2174161.1 hypothetical protein [Terracoccus luteus]
MDEQHQDEVGPARAAVDIDTAAPGRPRSLLRVWVILIVVLLANAGAVTWWVVGSSRDQAGRDATAATAAASTPIAAATTSQGLGSSPSPTTSTSSPAPAVVEPAPVRTVGNYDAWIVLARNVLDEEVATDPQMISLGFALCREVPISSARAEELASGLGPALVGLTAENVMDLSDVAEQTICPSGVMLPNPAMMPEPTPVALPNCPTMKQLKNALRVVSSHIDSSRGFDERVYLIELRFTNPRPYPVYLNGEVAGADPDGPTMLLPWEPSTYVQDLHGIKLKPGKTTIRMEVTGSGSDHRISPLSWDYWAIAPSENVTDDGARCEQTTS